MKRIIEYYYSFKNIDINKISNEYFFKYNNKKYIFMPTRRSNEELKILSDILRNNKKYNKIIYNIFNQLITLVDGKQYILVEKINNYSIEKINIEEMIKIYRIQNKKEYNPILRTDWYTLWTKKIDYILYQREHIRGKYQIIEEYLDYFIGMAENAISYYKNTIDTMQYNDIYALSHRRVKSALKTKYYNIDDLVIDYPVRTLSEYLKYLFFNDNINFLDAYKFISKINYNQFLYQLLYARMLFPSYFFDVYEEIVNNNLSEKEVIPIINRIQKYEQFLKIIFYVINKKTKIPQIEWLS